MTPLLTVLGAVLCSVMVSCDIAPKADFNAQQVSGKWYLIGFSSNAQWFIRRKDTMKMGTSMITPTANGDLEMSYASLNSDGTCWRKNSLAKKTDVAGKFTYTCQRWASENDLRWVEVKSDEYALTHTIKTKAGATTVVNKLYGRTADLSTDLKEKFRQFSLQTGVLSENIAFLPKNAECPAA